MLQWVHMRYRVTLPHLLHISKCSVLFDSTSNKFVGASLVKILVKQRSTWQSIRNPSFQSCTFLRCFLCVFCLSLFRFFSLFFWVRITEVGRHITYLWCSYFQRPASILVFIFGEWKMFVMEWNSCVVAQTDSTRLYHRRAELFFNTVHKLGSSESDPICNPSIPLLHSKLGFLSFILQKACSEEQHCTVGKGVEES